MNKFLKFAAPLVCGATAAGSAVAGTGGSEFEDVNNLLTSWTEGVLGRILAVGALIVGIAFGLVRQSVIAAVIGISMAVVLAYGPTVIGSIVSTTADGAVLSQVAMLANGLI